MIDLKRFSTAYIPAVCYQRWVKANDKEVTACNVGAFKT